MEETEQFYFLTPHNDLLVYDHSTNVIVMVKSLPMQLHIFKNKDGCVESWRFPTMLKKSPLELLQTLKRMIPKKPIIIGTEKEVLKLLDFQKLTVKEAREILNDINLFEGKKKTPLKKFAELSESEISKKITPVEELNLDKKSKFQIADFSDFSAEKIAKFTRLGFAESEAFPSEITGNLSYFTLISIIANYLANQLADNN